METNLNSTLAGSSNSTPSMPLVSTLWKSIDDWIRRTNFGSVGESRVALHKFALAHRFYSSLSKKKDANYTRAKCTAKECPWKLTAMDTSYKQAWHCKEKAKESSGGNFKRIQIQALFLYCVEVVLYWFSLPTKHWSHMYI